MLTKVVKLLPLAALGLWLLWAPAASAAFDDITVSPRARAMGEASVAVPAAGYAAWLNPAHLSLADGGTASAAYVRPFGLDFTDFLVIGGAVPLTDRWGHVGFGLSQFKVSYDDTDLMTETQLTLAHGLNLYSDYHSRVDFGWALNMYGLEFGQSVTGEDPGEDTVFGVDLGMIMTLHKRTQLAFRVKNLNHPQIGVDNEELPQRLTGGVSYQPYTGVITTFEIQNELGQDVQYRGGTEFEIVPSFLLRAGLTTSPNKMTAGFGYLLAGFSLDYGFSTGGGALDSTHQFGLNFAWGGEAP